MGSEGEGRRKSHSEGKRACTDGPRARSERQRDYSEVQSTFSDGQTAAAEGEAGCAGSYSDGGREQIRQAGRWRHSRDPLCAFRPPRSSDEQSPADEHCRTHRRPSTSALCPCLESTSTASGDGNTWFTLSFRSTICTSPLRDDSISGRFHRGLSSSWTRSSKSSSTAFRTSSNSPGSATESFQSIVDGQNELKSPNSSGIRLLSDGPALLPPFNFERSDRLQS